MKFVFFKPRHEILQKYIESYYFVIPENSKQEVKYFTFPNNFTILSVVKNAEEVFEKNAISVSSSKEENIKISVVNQYEEPIKIHYKEEITEITIYFKPLGIDQFLEPDHTVNINGSKTGNQLHQDFEEKMNEIFSENDITIKIQLLEDYWLSKFNEKHFPLIEKIIQLLNDDVKINDIATQLNISRQYLNKIFIKTIGKKPSEYKKINRFRKSVKNKETNDNLTDLSYDNRYFDQSHFIRDFKSLTQLKPSLFFKNIDLEKENFWLYM